MSTPVRDALDRNSQPWLFATAIATAAPHALHQPLWLTALAAVCVSWAVALWHGERRLPGRWLLIPVALGGFAGIVLEFGNPFGRDPGVATLVLFMAMKLLEVKARRDAAVVVTLGFFLLLTHFLYSQSIPTGLWLLACLWLLTATLVRINGAPADNVRAIARYSGILCLQALPFMVVLFVLFPRISGPLWGLPADAHAGRTGLSERIEPGTISQLARSGEIAFRARFDGPVPPRHQLYWRGPVMDELVGTTWVPSEAKGEAPRIEALETTTTYEMTLEAHNQRWLLALDAPVGLNSDFGQNFRLTVTSREPVTERRRYRLAASLDYRFNVDEAAAVLQRSLALPPGRNPQSRALGASWRAAGLSPEAIANEALKRFAADFTYTLQPPLLGRDAADEFLFRTKRGFCEHFATAFVVLMRAAGVPARVVTGYQGGEYNPLDGYLVVRQSEAHAWAEIWIERQGWVRIDPTAAVSPTRIETGIADALPDDALPIVMQWRADWVRDLRYRWEAINNAWNQHILGYDPTRQRDLLRRLGWPDIDWRGLTALLAGACGVLVSALLAWTILRRQPVPPVERLWRKALRHLARSGVDCAPWETPQALAERVARQLPAKAESFRQVAAAYQLARYGKETQPINVLRDAVARLTR